MTMHMREREIRTAYTGICGRQKWRASSIIFYTMAILKLASG